MLSVLIPVYEWDVTQLVNEVHSQCSQLDLEFEIICFNDGSSSKNPFSQLSQFKWIDAEVNVGRSATRNKMVELAKFSNCLFLDADMAIDKPSFIKKYAAYLEEEGVYCGGVKYDSSAFTQAVSLRYNYGKSKEETSASERSMNPHLSFMTGNFMASKCILEKHKFDESIKSYGHEDTLMGKYLLEDGILINHIENAAVHLGLEPNQVFLEKSKKGVETLAQLYAEHKITRHYSKIIKWYENIVLLKGITLVLGAIDFLENRSGHRLKHLGKSLWLFQLLKLKWFIECRKAI